MGKASNEQLTALISALQDRSNVLLPQAPVLDADNPDSVVAITLYLAELADALSSRDSVMLPDAGIIASDDSDTDDSDQDVDSSLADDEDTREDEVVSTEELRIGVDGGSAYQESGVANVMIPLPDESSPAETPVVHIEVGPGIEVTGGFKISSTVKATTTLQSGWSSLVPEIRACPVFKQVNLSSGINAAVGVPSPVTGLVKGLGINTNDGYGHTAGLVDFIVYTPASEDLFSVVTGTLSPDSTGAYIANGTHSAVTAYTRMDGAYELWFDGADWVISTIRGTSGADYWDITAASRLGLYSPQGTATGDATVASGPQPGAPQIDGIDTSDPTSPASYGTVQSAGLPVGMNDELQLWCRAAAGGPPPDTTVLDFAAATSFTIEEGVAYIVTGTLSPVSIGIYIQDGLYGGAITCAQSGGSYVLWFNGSVWIISLAAGATGAYWWQSPTAVVTGSYAPNGTATGTATVATYP